MTTVSAERLAAIFVEVADTVRRNSSLRGPGVFHSACVSHGHQIMRKAPIRTFTQLDGDIHRCVTRVCSPAPTVLAMFIKDPATPLPHSYRPWRCPTRNSLGGPLPRDGSGHKGLDSAGGQGYEGQTGSARNRT